jgi:hypothetical protein
MKSHHLLPAIAALCIAGSLSSCSLGVGKNQTVTVNSNVPAKITANGTVVGTAPLSFEARRAKSLALIATAPGYTQTTKTVSRQMSQSGILDGIGGLLFLVPWIGLASDGAWELEEDNIFMNLEKR